RRAPKLLFWRNQMIMKPATFNFQRLNSLALFFAAACSASAAIVSPNTNLTAREERIISASKQFEPAPGFRAPRIIGIRPTTPLRHLLPVTGTRPLSFSASDLPAGLALDAQTGLLTGSLDKASDYTFIVTAKNASGQASAEIKIVCGDTLALTPPMGWNS